VARWRMTILRCSKAVVLAVFFVGVATANTGHAATRDPQEHFFQQSFGDLREELQTARQSGKKAVFMMFDNAECPWCHKIKTTILNQVEVQDYFRKNFQIVRVDTEGSNPIIDFDGKEYLEKDYTLLVNRVRATPVFIFFDLEGKQIFRHTGTVRDQAEFMWLGEFVVGEHYKTKRFAVYKRERMAASGK